MFENLSNKLTQAIKTLKGQGKITEINVASTIKEIRRALISADVHYKIAKEVTDRIKEQALGRSVRFSVSPGQLLTKIVNEELACLMGSEQVGLSLTGKPAIILMAGLQGAGKTTFAGKLALHLKKKNKSVLLAGCDIYRPAAMEQLKVVGEQVGVETYIAPENNNVLHIAQDAVKHAKTARQQVVIIDTAGRLAIDEAMMQEIAGLKKALQPAETLFVVDAMTGQDAVHTAQAFHEQLDFDGVVLTKLDGDTRGGAALSIRTVINKPIKFIGTGEKMEAIDVFYPDRMANRILGMGDVVSLVERAEQLYNQQANRKLSKKFHQNQFNLNDFLVQIQKIKKMGNVKDLLGMLPGMKTETVDETVFHSFEVMIQSMTPQERANPDLLNRSRRKRVAMGSGTSIDEVHNLLHKFNDLIKVIKKGAKRKYKGMPLPGLSTD